MADDLALVVDVFRAVEMQWRWCDQRVEIVGGAVVPEDRVEFMAAAIGHVADCLVERVDAEGVAARGAVDRREVMHDAVCP
jgi:hypothetical protein